jgi:hypothetical protein
MRNKGVLLVDEGTVKCYKADLIEEIEPEINGLIHRAQHSLDTLQKRENLLLTKVPQFFVRNCCYSSLHGLI